MNKHSKILIGIIFNFLVTSYAFMSGVLILIQNNGIPQYLSVDSTTGTPVMSVNPFYWGQEFGPGNPGPSRFFCTVNGERMFLSAPQQDGARVMLKKDGSQELWWSFGNKLVLYTYLDLYLKNGEVCVQTLSPNNNAWTVVPSSSAPSTVSFTPATPTPPQNPPVVSVEPTTVTTSVPTAEQLAVERSLALREAVEAMNPVIQDYLRLRGKKRQGTFSEDDQKDFDLVWGEMKELINRGYDPNLVWTSNLWQDDNAFLNFYLQNGANPSHKFKMGKGTWTPLLQAVSLNKLALIETLVNAGADVKGKATPFPVASGPACTGEQSPLSYAICSQNSSSSYSGGAYWISGRGGPDFKSIIDYLKSKGATE